MNITLVSTLKYIFSLFISQNCPTNTAAPLASLVAAAVNLSNYRCNSFLRETDKDFLRQGNLKDKQQQQIALQEHLLVV